MRQIKTANIKVDVFPIVASKKDTVLISKKDFTEQLESFLKKDNKTNTKNDESKVVTTDKKAVLKTGESEEDFDAELNINLVDLNNILHQPFEQKNDGSLMGEVVELPAEEVTVDSTSVVATSGEVFAAEFINLGKNEELAFKVESLLSESLTSASDDASNSINQAQVEDILLDLETQLSEDSELDVKDIIEGLLAENNLELDKVFKNPELASIEKISQVGLDPNLPDTQNLELKENYKTNETQDKGVAERTAIEQTKLTIESNARELGVENEAESQTVELSSIETFEPINRIIFAKDTNTPVQSVTQEDFVSNIETLIIDETESSEGGDRVTTARIQLTPDHLGKVDLQIKINGKELTAKLVVEQKETKEWIDQQVAHLKEELLTQEITVKDFQVVVQEENLNDAFMNSEENPFFKQKEKDSQTQKEQRILKSQLADLPVKQEERSYSAKNGISILV